MVGHRFLSLTLALFFGGACATVSKPESTTQAGQNEAPAQAVVPYEEQDAATREANARLEGYFPNHELITHEGKKVRFYDELVRDKQVLINFMYVQCDGL